MQRGLAPRLLLLQRGSANAFAPRAPRRLSSTGSLRAMASQRCGGGGGVDEGGGAQRDGGIVLTETERKIFDTLVETCKYHNVQTTLRVAGGWVRDKVLGLASGDIDIALDDTMGQQFATKVNEYLSEVQGEQTHSIGVIMSNPEQSKHLETATMKIHGQWIDFVNLRTETYAEGSRIPDCASFGTPKEDAFRRDLTINSLFFNINTGCIEDFTGHGLSDIREGIVRTPLPPKETFLDDPLRVLRAVRFAARFNFDLDTGAGLAMESDVVLAALEQKVSRERIGTELDGMIKGPDPGRAAQVLERHGVLRVMLGADALGSYPNACSMSGDGAAAVQAVDAAMKLLIDDRTGSFAIPTECKRIALLSALLIGAREHSYVGPKKKTAPLAQGIVLEKLKLSKRDADSVVAVHESMSAMAELVSRLTCAGQARSPAESCETSSLSAGGTRRDVGLLVRRLKENWIPALLMAPLASVTVSGDVGETRAGFMDSRQWADACSEFRVAVEAAGLGEAWTIKPLLSGKDVMEHLGMKSGGPVLGKAMSRLMDWQLENPEGDKDACLRWFDTSLRAELEHFKT